MTYVLLHGAWHGGWCWDRVTALLTARGHQVLAPTLAGLAERADELSEDIALDTHIQEVVDLLRDQNLAGVTLVGHSYAGLVIAGVADRVPHHLGRLVFLDAVIIEPGQRWRDAHTPEEAASRLARTRDGGIPAPDAKRFGITDPADVDMVQARLTPQPVGTYVSRLELHNPWGNGLPRMYVDCHRPALPGLAATKLRLQSDPEWLFVQLDAGHDAMIGHPQAVADLLEAWRAPDCGTDTAHAELKSPDSPADRPPAADRSPHPCGLRG